MGVNKGDKAIIGAMSFVNKNIPENGTEQIKDLNIDLFILY